MLSDDIAIFFFFGILYSELYELRARHDKELLHKPAISKHKIIPSQSFNSNHNSSSLSGNFFRYLGNIPYFWTIKSVNSIYLFKAKIYPYTNTKLGP